MLPGTVQINLTTHAMLMNACSNKRNHPAEDDQFLLYCFFRFVISAMAHSAVVQDDCIIAMDIAWLKLS